MVDFGELTPPAHEVPPSGLRQETLSMIQPLSIAQCTLSISYAAPPTPPQLVSRLHLLWNREENPTGFDTQRQSIHMK